MAPTAVPQVAADNPKERWHVRGTLDGDIAALHGSRHRVGVGAGIDISAIRPIRFPFAALPQNMDAAATATSLDACWLSYSEVAGYLDDPYENLLAGNRPKVEGSETAG